jgi:hypothetical protein
MRSMESAAGGASEIYDENLVGIAYLKLTDGSKSEASEGVLASSVFVDELLDLSSGSGGHWDFLAVDTHVRASGEDA